MSKVGYMFLGLVSLTVLGVYLYFRGPGPAGWPDCIIVVTFALLVLAFVRPRKFDEAVKSGTSVAMQKLKRRK